jgi:hypothetical protein
MPNLKRESNEKMSYRLNCATEGIQRKFKRDELDEMTTIQLRNICFQEKIVKGVIHTLDRENLIRTILKYRGAEESYLINRFYQGGFERVGAALGYLNLCLPDRDQIKIPAKISLYREIGVTAEDMYKVIANNEIGESNALLLNDQNQLCGIFNLVRDQNCLENEKLFFLVANAKTLRIGKSNNRKFSLLFFKKNDSEYLYKTYYAEKHLPPSRLEYYRIPLADLEIRDMETTQTVLAIDFGTSNTTAGAYLSNNYVSHLCYNDLLNQRITLNEINFVKFSDAAQKNERRTEVIPTIVYVADCADPENIRYYFGYEAKNAMRKNDYTSGATVFQGIKRWVNNYHQLEAIADEAGNIATVRRSEIIKAFLIHLIQTAERQFKCRFKNLHISSPVKLKQQFVEMFQAILPEYRVESEDVLDEGIAVLYNTIADQIEKKKFSDGAEYKALVIDCGGGTTDLSSCTFKIEEGYISYKVDVHTTFENGDTNFGGNNISYRILQFMKIVFAYYYTTKKEIIDIDSLIEIPGNDIFRYVDEMGVAGIYANFEKAYHAAEAVIPTRFKEYENRLGVEYQRVRNNFYFLWEIADNMKQEFFRKTNILRNRFDASALEVQESDLHITTLNKWCISLMKDGEFRDIYDFPKVVFNIKEINKLIKADIYEIVRKFLEKFYESRELLDYSIIKLTGQSCRIDIFKEALKEFVPGRSIEFKQKNEEDEYTPDLKLACLRGVLRYFNSKKLGDIEATIHNDIPFVPYSISAFTYNKQEKKLIYSFDRVNQAVGFISRPIGTAEISFYMKNQDGVLRREYILETDFNDYQLTCPEEITGLYPGKINQEDTDTIKNGETRFFLFTHDKNWGFHVVPIARREEQLYIGKKKYFAFEDELSELDFFDGLK